MKLNSFTNCDNRKLYISSYDSTTGVFTVPPDGDGLYYFSIFLTGDDANFTYFDMNLNDDVICSTFLDTSDTGSGDSAAGSCSAVVDVVAGDVCLK